jgi:hypothetical protein
MTSPRGSCRWLVILAATLAYAMVVYLKGRNS